MSPSGALEVVKRQAARPARPADDDAADHSGTLVRRAEVIVDALDGQDDRKGCGRMSDAQGLAERGMRSECRSLVGW